MKKILLGIIILIIVGLIGVVFFTKGDAKKSTMGTKQPENTIVLKNYAFEQKRITIKKGITITWVNQDQTKHTVTSDLDSKQKVLSSDYFGNNETFKYTFNEVGVYKYHCEPHPYMKGEIEVTE